MKKTKIVKVLLGILCWILAGGWLLILLHNGIGLTFFSSASIVALAAFGFALIFC